MTGVSLARRWLYAMTVVIGCACALAMPPALAHKASDAYLTIRADAPASSSASGVRSPIAMASPVLPS